MLGKNQWNSNTVLVKFNESDYSIYNGCSESDVFRDFNSSETIDSSTLIRKQHGQQLVLMCNDSHPKNPI